MAKETKAEQLAEAEKKKQGGIRQAEFDVDSIANAAMSIHYIDKESPDLLILRNQLGKKIDKVIAGDIRDIERMLMSQAQVLNVVFNRMIMHVGSAAFISHLQAYSEIALKAQNQCRQTLAALAELKNPKRTMFVKQQNLALNQQVNNNTRPENSQKTEKPANELLIEAKEHEALDIGGTAKTIPANSKLEAVEVGRSEDARGQSHQQDERL